MENASFNWKKQQRFDQINRNFFSSDEIQRKEKIDGGKCFSVDWIEEEREVQLVTMSLKLIGKYSIEKSFIPLICCGEDLILLYEEKNGLIRLFNRNGIELVSIPICPSLVDLCYSNYFHSFILLSEKNLYELNLELKEIHLISEYHLLKETRSMSSICSIGDDGLIILYRFGEYLDRFPQTNRIWKRRHLCSNLNEDIFLIRSTEDVQCVVALLIVEWNGIWRVDIFSQTLHKLYEGFRFNGWTRLTFLSQWNCSFECWIVGDQHRIGINRKGQPISFPTQFNQFNSFLNLISIQPTSNEQNPTIVIRDQQKLLFFK